MKHPRIILEDERLKERIKELEIQAKTYQVTQAIITSRINSLERENESLRKWKQAVLNDAEKFNVQNYLSKNGGVIISDVAYKGLREKGLL